MRTVALPTGLEADKAEATFEHGVLKLRFPRMEAVKPRQIRITTLDSVGAPQYRAILRWNSAPKFAADQFTFTPAKGMTEIPLDKEPKVASGGAK